MKTATVGLDVAKSVFQVHGANAEGRAVLRKRLRRNEVAGFEACIGAYINCVPAEACNQNDPCTWPAASNWSCQVMDVSIPCGELPDFNRNSNCTAAGCTLNVWQPSSTVTTYNGPKGTPQSSTDPGYWTTFTGTPIVPDPLEDWQKNILGQTGKLATEEVKGGVEGLGASALIGAGIGGAALLTGAGQAITSADVLAQNYVANLLWNDEFMANVSDFARAWIPDGAPVPPTIGGVLGATIAERHEIIETTQEAYEWVKESVPH